MLNCPGLTDDSPHTAACKRRRPLATTMTARFDNGYLESFMCEKVGCTEVGEDFPDCLKQAAT